MWHVLKKRGGASITSLWLPYWLFKPDPMFNMINMPNMFKQEMNDERSHILGSLGREAQQLISFVGVSFNRIACPWK